MQRSRIVDGGFRDLGRLVLGMVLVALSAQVSVPVPGTPVPQSLQTLAVVVVGAWLGPRDGALALALYVVVGAAGLPVFADGAGGAGHLVGPTMGYLVGFIAGAALMGWWVRRPWGRGVLAAFGGGVCAHVLILFFGWVRLGALVGPVEAYASGVAPFVVGGVVKAAGAAAVWGAIRRRVEPVEPDLVA